MNRGSDSILSVYSDARAEYTKQLCVFLVPAYFQFFIELLEKSKQEMINEPKRALWQFQNYLNEIHDWNMEKVHNEIQKINTNSGCDYLEDLLTAVFIAHTKVLTAIRLSANKKKIEINVPKVEHFLFKVLCETSKLLWSSTYLFRDGIPGIEKQQNYRNIEQIINEGILQAVRSLVPVKSILRDFVTNDDNAVAEEDNSDDEKDNDDDEKDNDDKKEIAKSTEELVIPQAVSIPERSEESTIEAISPDVPSSNVPSSEIAPIINIQEVPKNEIMESIQQTAPTIIIDDKPSVRFGEYNTVFDIDNPNNSDLIYESKENEDDEEEVPALEILDDQGAPLSEGLDFEDLNEKEDEPESLGLTDYEELN
jgi:hypothetical protein